MTLASFATLAVATAFAVLCVWVLWPGNKKRLEDHGRIPLDEDPTVITADSMDAGKETRT